MCNSSSGFDGNANVHSIQSKGGKKKKSMMLLHFEVVYIDPAKENTF